tara:strand:+ start:2558 stop:2890 length:333 start_codon:yes stop_codon:yes gene_type:complete
MNLVFPVYKLPYELQHKILYMVMKHPISYMIKDLKKEVDNLNNCRFNLDTKKIEPISFYECLQNFRVLNRPRCRCIVCRNPVLYLINKIENGGDLSDYEEELAIHLFDGL